MDSLKLLKVSTDNHTMGDSLLPYIEMKMRPLLKNNKTKPVRVQGHYNWVGATIDEFSKRHKLFNWQRPTVSETKDYILINCYPGKDYVYHYGNLISTYYHLLGLDIEVNFISPTEETCISTLNNSNLNEIPNSDVVILGYVEQLSSLLEKQDWKGSKEFLYKTGKVNNTTVNLVGCKHSYWADISGHLVNLLSKKTSLVIYIGKLGSIDSNHKANLTLATGNKSFLNNKFVTWNNIFSEVNNSFLKKGVHYNLPSVIQETKDWLSIVKDSFSFVDPEIGYMAEAANCSGIDFSYLHIVSDNLTTKMSEDLSNERDLNVLSKRVTLLNEVKSILQNTF